MPYIKVVVLIEVRVFIIFGHNLDLKQENWKCIKIYKYENFVQCLPID